MMYLLLVLSIKSIYYSKRINETSISRNKNDIVIENNLDSNQYVQNCHSVTIINNITDKNYRLSFMDNKYPELIINQTSFKANFPFKVYLNILSEKCKPSMYFLTVNSTVDEWNKIIINDLNIPEKCRNDYNLTIKNNFSLSSYHLYYRFYDNNFYEIKNSVTLNFISVDLYMKSDNCNDYTFISTVNTTINQSTEIIINDSDAPHTCLIPYSITIHNNFNIPEYKLYYYDSEYRKYVQIEKNFTKKSNNFFGISLYMSSDKCNQEFMYTINATLCEHVVKFVSNSDALKKCQFCTNFLKIMTNITYPETYVFRQNEYRLIFSITTLNISSTDSINESLYINSTYCPKRTYLNTFTGSDDYELITYIQNSDVPPECKPSFQYQLTVLNNFTNENYKLYVRNSSTSFTEIKDVLNMQKSEPFSVDIYMKYNYSKNECYLSTVQSTDNLAEKIIFNDADVPINCISSSKYFMKIINRAPSDLSIYRMNEYGLYIDIFGYFENESYEPFQYDLYVFSHNCYGMYYFRTVKATTSNTDVLILDNDKIPYRCQKGYYFITIEKGFKLKEYQLYYYEISNSTYIEIDYSIYYSSPKPYALQLYVKTTFCPSLDCIGSFNLLNKSYTLKINESYIKEECLSPYRYFAKIIKQFTLNYSLYYLNETTDEYIEIKDSYFFESHDYIQIKLYIYYEVCKTYSWACTVPLSEVQSFTKTINDQYVRFPCTIHNVKFVTANLSQNYTIGYKITYESSDIMHSPAIELNVIKSTEHFNVSFYLLNHKKCDNLKFLEYDSRKSFNIHYIYDNDIPKECRTDEIDNHYKPNVGLIVGVSCAGFVVVVALCILTVYLVRKRKNKQENNNSNQISEMLQEDNGYTS